MRRGVACRLQHEPRDSGHGLRRCGWAKGRSGLVLGRVGHGLGREGHGLGRTALSTLGDRGGRAAVCAPANATGSCTAGSCALAACTAGFADCDQSAWNGCEVDLMTDPGSCGACGNSCGGAACVNGGCDAFASTGVEGDLFALSNTTLTGGVHNFRNLALTLRSWRWKTAAAARWACC